MLSNLDFPLAPDHSARLLATLVRRRLEKRTLAGQPGHPFYGNQYTDTASSGKLGKVQQERLTRAHDQARDMGKAEKREVAAVIDETGKVVGQAKGTAHKVRFTGDVAARMMRGPKTLVATHSHPNEVSLSAADINIAEQKGVLENWATTPGGSVYGVSGVKEGAAKAYQEHQDRIVAAAKAIAVDNADLQGMNPYVSHLTMRSLALGKHLTYHEKLSDRDKSQRDRPAMAATMAKWAKKAGLQW
jgi:hypothetical protein